MSFNYARPDEPSLSVLDVELAEKQPYERVFRLNSYRRLVRKFPCMEEFVKPEAMYFVAGMDDNSTLCDMTQPTTKNECKLLTSSVTPSVFSQLNSKNKHTC